MRCLSLAATLVVIAAASAETTTFDKHIEESSKFAYRTEIESDQTLTVAGMEVVTKSSRSLLLNFEVGKRDGTLPVKITFNKLFVDMSLPGGIQLQFDSANPNAEADGPLAFVVDIFRALNGASLTYQLDDKYKVTTIEGIDDIVNAAASSQASDLLRMDLNSDRLAEEFQRDFTGLPDGPVKVGDTWKRTQKVGIGGGQTFTFDVEYKYAGTEEKDGRTLDKIVAKNTSVTYEQEGNAGGPAVTNSDLKVDSSETVMYYDRTFKGVRSTESKNHIVGDLTLSINGNDLPAKLDLTIKSTMTLEQ